MPREAEVSAAGVQHPHPSAGCQSEEKEQRSGSLVAEQIPEHVSQKRCFLSTSCRAELAVRLAEQKIKSNFPLQQSRQQKKAGLVCLHSARLCLCHARLSGFPSANPAAPQGTATLTPPLPWHRGGGAPPSPIFINKRAIHFINKRARGGSACLPAQAHHHQLPWGMGQLQQGGC